MNKLKQIWKAHTLGILLALITLVTPFAITPLVAAGTATTCTKPTFLGMESWYAYLKYAPDPTLGTCTVQLDGTNLLGKKGSDSPILLIALAVVDDLIRIAALVAVGYVVYGGMLYMTGGGSPESIKKAQNTIINALVGVVIAIMAASIVSFIGGKLGA